MVCFLFTFNFLTMPKRGFGPPGGPSLSGHVARELTRPRTEANSSHRLSTSATSSQLARPQAQSAYPNARRGNLNAALAAAKTPQLLQQTIETFLQDRYALSTQKSRETCLRTWVTMHVNAYQHEPICPPPFPLSVDSIQRVSSLFKAGNYLSFDNYILRAKSEHLATCPTSGSWTLELSTAVKDAMRSVNRHTGTSRQSRPLPLRHIVKLNIGAEPIVANGPICVVDLCIAG